MSGPHLSISDFRKAASSAWVEPFGSAPSSSNRGLTDAWASAALVSALILATTSGGVRTGTQNANHENTSKPGRPDSAMVGISGTARTRSLVVTASPRRLPAFTAGLHMRQDRGHVVEGDIDAAGNEVVDRRRPAAIRDMRHLDFRQPLEQFAAQMQRGADAGRGVGDLALVRMAIGDELLNRFRGRGIR